MTELQEYTVTQVSNKLSQVISGVFSDDVIVTGEVLGCKTYSSGHMYFTLSDGISSISAAFFKGYLLKSSFKPKDGDKVKVRGTIQLYDKTNTCQIIVHSVEYNSEGMLLKQFEETRKKLLQEGLLDAERKRPIPAYPYRVAILTSKSGAVIRDFMKTTKNEGGIYKIELWDIPVQGLNTAPQIAETIKKAGMYKDRYDVIVVMRGGGSFEDLAVFNDERIARAAAGSNVPVISAIGHETDTTILDYAADMRAATPTAAALHLSSGYKHARTFISEKTRFLRKMIDTILMRKNQNLDFALLKLEKYSPDKSINNKKDLLRNLEKSLKQYIKTTILSKYSSLDLKEKLLYNNNPEKKLKEMDYRLSVMEKSLVNKTQNNILDVKRRVEDYKGLILLKMNNSKESKLKKYMQAAEVLNRKNPCDKIERYKVQLDMFNKGMLPVVRQQYSSSKNSLLALENRIKHHIGNYLFYKNADVNVLENKLRLLDPDNVLERGYALVSQGGKIVSGVSEISISEAVSIQMKDGRVEAVPVNIEKNDTLNKSNNENEEKIYK